MKKLFILISIFFTLSLLFVNKVSADGCTPCDAACKEYWSTPPRTFIPCDSPGCDDGDDDEEETCTPHNCTLPACPAGTTSTNTGYPAKSVSCDKGCGETKTGMCYEIPPYCDPAIEDCDEYPNWTDAEVEFKPVKPSNTNVYDCTSDISSGLSINNPVAVEAKYSSSVDVKTLEAVYFWMSKTGTAPTEIQWLGASRSSGKTRNNYSFGFMVRKVSGSWKEIYVPYLGDKMYWVKVAEVGSDFTIEGPTGKAMVRITNLALSQTNKVVSNFNIEFLNKDSKVDIYEQVYQGKYDVYAMANDTFGFTPYDNYTNPDKLNKLPYKANQIRFYKDWRKGDQWTVDLTPPTVDPLSMTINGPTEVSLFWNSQDNETRITNSVGNAFRLKQDMIKNAEITYPYPGGSTFLLNFQKESDLIGKLTGDNILWKVLNLASREEKMGLGLNRGGYVDFFVTTFDLACNSTTKQLRFKLGEWIQSRGGFFFSQGGTSVDVRELSSNVWLLSDLFEYGFTESTADLSTELLTGTVDSVLNLRILLNRNASYRVTNITNPYTKDIYYTYFKKLKNVSPDVMTQIDPAIKSLNGKLSDYCLEGYCADKVYVANVEGNLAVSKGFLCDGRGVFLIKGDLNIEPDFKGVKKSDACVFIVNGNINIGKGDDHTTSTSMGFDVIEAYMMSGGVINILNENKPLNARKDALIVEGGLIAFGKDPDTGVSINIARELHLQDRHPYPVVNVVNHVKYGKLINALFGGEKLVFKSEIGLKPF